MRLHLWANLRDRAYRRMVTWCGAACSRGRHDDLACTRQAGHVGKHIALFRDAVFADRYAATSGYRRQRRKLGYRARPSRKRAGHLRLARAAFSLLARTPSMWPLTTDE